MCVNAIKLSRSVMGVPFIVRAKRLAGDNSIWIAKQSRAEKKKKMEATNSIARAQPNNKTCNTNYTSENEIKMMNEMKKLSAHCLRLAVVGEAVLHSKCVKLTLLTV